MSDTSMIPFEHVQQMAKSAASCGFFPGIRTPEQALVLMSLAQAEGIAPIQAMMRYDIIQGRPAKRSQAMLSDFLAAGGKVEWLQHGPTCCEGKFSHPQGGEIVVKWDMETAKKADLLGKDNWRKHPENMLHARCVSNGVRFVYPAATGGLYEPSEVQDFSSDKFSALPQEKTQEEKNSPVAIHQVVVPSDVPETVTVIPLSLCKGVFKSLAQFDGVPLQQMMQPDLELIVSVISEHRMKVRDSSAKAWLSAIEDHASSLLQEAQSHEAYFKDTNE